jgi:uncharacterized protein YegL
MTSKSTVSVSSIQSLISGVAQSDDAANLMINSLNDTNIIGCTGVDIDDLATDCVTLASIIIDASYSMKSNELVVREGFDELVIKAMSDSKQSESMLVSTRTFSTDENILYGFKKVADIGKIGSQYIANGSSTRLYDSLVNAITAIRAYAKTLNDGGVRTKCVVVAMTDGHDNDSQSYTASDVEKLVTECHKSEMFYFVYVGFKENPSDDFAADAKAIGFPNVLTTTNSGHDIRQAMGLMSQSIIRKSQTIVGPSNSFFQ